MDPYYSDEFITLYHGDCLENLTWLEADTLITDPPYGLNYAAKKGIYKGPGQVHVYNSISGDKNAALRDKVIDLWGDKPALVFGTWRVARPAKTRNRLIWYKKGSSPGPANHDFMSNDEEIYVLGKGFVKSAPPQRTVIMTTEHRSTAVRLIGHPTPKPYVLMDTLVGRTIGTIADPFAGSGATLLAAKMRGRTAIGIEMSEEYCELAAKRISNPTERDFTR